MVYYRDAKPRVRHKGEVISVMGIAGTEAGFVVTCSPFF